MFRVDRYDRAGNRLTPIAVEMQARRAGRITDGDEVEVAGRWSRGTLHAGRITNLTTASEVVGYPRWLKWVVLGFFLLVVAGGCAAVASQVLPKVLGGSISVPEVAGMQQVAAFGQLAEAGLFPETISESSDTVAAGHVVRTVPPAGALANRGSSINLVVSSGPSGSSQATSDPGSAPAVTTPADGSVPIPALVGLDQASAEAALAASGLSAGSNTEASDSVPEGQVIRSEPGAGTMLVPGDQVLVVVSSGPVPAPNPTPAPDVVVPLVAGQDEATANQTLTDAGFLVVVVYEGFCFGEHAAIRTEPTEGTVLPAGSTITLVSSC